MWAYAESTHYQNTIWPPAGHRQQILLHRKTPRQIPRDKCKSHHQVPGGTYFYGSDVITWILSKLHLGKASNPGTGKPPFTPSKKERLCYATILLKAPFPKHSRQHHFSTHCLEHVVSFPFITRLDTSHRGYLRAAERWISYWQPAQAANFAALSPRRHSSQVCHRPAAGPTKSLQADGTLATFWMLVSGFTIRFCRTEHEGTKDRAIFLFPVQSVVPRFLATER